MYIVICFINFQSLPISILWSTFELFLQAEIAYHKRQLHILKQKENDKVLFKTQNIDINIYITLVEM